MRKPGVNKKNEQLLFFAAPLSALAAVRSPRASAEDANGGEI